MQHEQKLKNIISHICKNNDTRPAISSLNHIKTILKKTQNKTLSNKSKKINLSSFVNKKFITNTLGCVDLLLFCGAIKKSMESKKYLILPSNKCHQQIIQIIENSIRELKNSKNQTIPNLSLESLEKKSVRCKCGFWGSTQTMNMCSSCYQIYLKQKKHNIIRLWKKAQHIVIFVVMLLKKKLKLKKKKIQKNKNRCFQCNRKVGYLGFECNCGYIFCDIHRLPCDHNCSIDYKEKQKLKIKKENKQIVTDKLKDRI